jgi:hypothetical protein
VLSKTELLPDGCTQTQNLSSCLFEGIFQQFTQGRVNSTALLLRSWGLYQAANFTFEDSSFTLARFPPEALQIVYLVLFLAAALGVAVISFLFM